VWYWFIKDCLYFEKYCSKKKIPQFLRKLILKTNCHMKYFKYFSFTWNENLLSIPLALFEQLLHQYSVVKKLQSTTKSKENLHKTLLYKKAACKMLIKLTIGFLKSPFCYNILMISITIRNCILAHFPLNLWLQ